jgi:hypothetical protein
MMPVGVVSPMYGGSHAANSIETFSCPATIPASAEVGNFMTESGVVNCRMVNDKLQTF